MKNKDKKEEKRYCRYCGEKMIVRYIPCKEDMYDPITGKPTGKVYTRWKCPRKLFFFDNHSEWSDEPVKLQDFL